MIFIVIEYMSSHICFFYYSFTTAKPAAAAASKPAATPAAPKKAVVLDLSVLCAKTAAKPAAASAQKEAPKPEVKPVEEKKIEQPQPQKPKEYFFSFFLLFGCLIVRLCLCELLLLF